MGSRFINGGLLALMALLGLTGLVMLFGSWQGWVFEIHRIAGWMMIALIPWKAGIVYRSLKRGLGSHPDRNLILVLSTAMAVAVVGVLVLGLFWAWRLGPDVGWLGQSVIAWHWILGLVVIPIFGVHIWRRWPKPSVRVYTSRRGALRALGFGVTGVVGWQFAEWLAQAKATDEVPRRFTGSRGEGIFTGNDFPITGEPPLEIDERDWELSVDGVVEKPLRLTYGQILCLPTRAVSGTLDCTSGWYTVQRWRGVALTDLLTAAGAPPEIAGVKLHSRTGYWHAFFPGESRRILLATHVGREPLAPRHGFPLRAVVPDRRGWFWVKWLSRVQVVEDPVEILLGLVWSPRQTLRQL